MDKHTLLTDTFGPLQAALEQEQAAIRTAVAPLVAKREALVAAIQPLEAELRQINAAIKTAEAPLRPIGIKLAAIARATGARTMTNEGPA